MQHNEKSIDSATELEPMPPDNIREWEQLPESFRETIADKFENGIAHEWELQLERNDRAERSRDLRELRRAPAKRVAA